MLPSYPAVVLSVGRYLAFGLIAVALAWPARAALSRLSRADWAAAACLSLIGNLLYYGCLAASIQTTGVPLPTMLIGTLPVVIAVVSNLSDRAMPWRRLAPSLVVILAGIALVNHAELARSADAADAPSAMSRAIGIALALGAVACWTWYPIRNARWMQSNPDVGAATWATAQGLTTLPLAIAGWGLAAAWHTLHPLGAAGAPFDFPLGPEPLKFVLLMVTIGLAASWLGTLLWNKASRLLPTSLAGQLIVFETLAALAYAFAWRGEWPAPSAVAGIALLVAGVVLGVRTFRREPATRALTSA